MYPSPEELILSLDLLFLFSVVVLWPLAAWKVWNAVWDLLKGERMNYDEFFAMAEGRGLRVESAQIAPESTVFLSN